MFFVLFLLAIINKGRGVELPRIPLAELGGHINVTNKNKQALNKLAFSVFKPVHVRILQRK